MEAPKTAQRNPSRTAVIAVVLVLIVVAIAGIVLAGRRTASPVQGTAAAVPDAPSVSTSTPQADAAPTVNPNAVVFASGSVKLPADASETIARFSETARGAGGHVRLSVRFPTGPDKSGAIELAKSRTAAVRHALESNGVKPEAMQFELVEMPAGVVSDKDANRVELSMR